MCSLTRVNNKRKLLCEQELQCSIPTGIPKRLVIVLTGLSQDNFCVAPNVPIVTHDAGSCGVGFVSAVEDNCAAVAQPLQHVSVIHCG